MSVLRILLLVLISLFIGQKLYSCNAEAVVGDKMPMPFGFGVSVVMSGSMEPALSVNDLVFVTSAQEVEEGDIVVFQQEGSLLIHRVVRKDGETLVTKGDANDAPDPPIRKDAIKGKAVGSLPWIGALILFVKSPAGFLLLLIGGVVLFELPYYRARKRALRQREELVEEIRQLKEQQGENKDD